MMAPGTKRDLILVGVCILLFVAALVLADAILPPPDGGRYL